MYKTVDWYTFSNWFKKSDNYKNNFSYDGLKALFDYLEEYEDSTGEKIEFDPIAICCEYSEYKNAVDAYSAYNTGTLDIDGDDEEMEAQALAWLEERTQVIQFDDNTVDGRGIIIQDF